MWTYKGIEIDVNLDGEFTFRFNSNGYKAETLRKAKKIIDEKTDAFYKISHEEVSNLLKKLNNKERTFVTQLIEELREHGNSAYCQIGISDYFLFDYDFKLDEE